MNPKPRPAPKTPTPEATPMRDKQGLIRLPRDYSHEQRVEYIKRLRAAYLKRGECCVEIKMVVRFASGGRMESTSIPEPPSMALKGVSRTLAPVIEIERRSALAADRKARSKRAGRKG